MEKRLNVMILCFTFIIWVTWCSASCGTYEGFMADVPNMKLLSVSGFPWLVSIQNLNGSHLEVGTIISEFWIVTAPSGLKMRTDLVGVVGITKLASKGVEERSHYPIRKVIVHQKFDEILLDHDLMLLMTEHKITFGRNVQPVCFPSQDPDNFAFTNCQVSSWRGQRAADKNYDCEAWHRLSVEDIDPCPLKRTVATECCSHHGRDSNPEGTEGNPVSCQVTGSDRWALAGILTGGGMKSYGPFLYTRTSYYSDWVSACTKEEGAPFMPTITLNKVVLPAPHVPQERAQMRSAAIQTEEKETLYYDYYNINEPEQSHGHQTRASVPLSPWIVLLLVYI